MKTILTVMGTVVAASAIALAAPSALACGGATPIPAKTKKATTPADVIIPVKGMVCGGCANKIQVALMKLDAVISAAVDHAKGEATVHYDAALLTSKELVTIINKQGYETGTPKDAPTPKRQS